MKKSLKTVCILLVVFSLLFAYACGNGDNVGNGGGDDINNGIERTETDERNLTAQEYTLANTVATDREGRVAAAGDRYNGNDVGMFYHVWHGVHETAGKVLDITELLKENPDYLGDEYVNENYQKFHYWGEPLYGYYCSSDPYIVTRHIEMLMAMGIDFLAYDYTNNTTYHSEADLLFETLQKFYDQGFTNVPKVTFYTNTGSANRICELYHRYYEQEKYKDLWYAPNGKPLIIGVRDDNVSPSNAELYEELYTDYFDFRESQWPDTTTVEDLETGFPWMNWCYPQKNYNGMMSVSLAQHPDAKMSLGARTNFGRGYDWKKMRNYTKNADLGTNYEGQWETVFKNNASSKNKYVTQVLVTGFNEWMAQKLSAGDYSFFVDTFSKEYSRDVEPMKGGYEDNYVIQTLTNTRKYKYTEAKHYKYELNTPEWNNFSADAWSSVKSEYRDLVGDAIDRNFRDAFRTTTYTLESARNDIASVKVTHDENNLYVRVQTAEDITPYESGENWMTLLLKTSDGVENTFGGFDYIINRSPADGKTSVEKSKGGYNWESVGSADYCYSGNVILYRIPLKTLGLSKNNCYVALKACDNVLKPDDIMDYYVSGDSAPIGRFAYAYGY